MDWSKKAKLEDKLFSPILKILFEELAKKNEIPSLIQFMYATQHSYSQLHKVRKYLIAKKIVKITKIGKETKIQLTPRGKKIVTDFIKLLNTIRKSE